MTDLKSVKAEDVVELKDHVVGLTTKVKEKTDGLQNDFSAMQEKMADLQDELIEKGEESCETKHKVEEISTHITDMLGEIQSYGEQIEAHKSAIEEMNVKMESTGYKAAAQDGDLVRKNAEEFYETVYNEQNCEQKNVAVFDPASVSQDMVEAYAHAESKAFSTWFGAPAAMTLGFDALDVEQRKSISTISHGTEMWLPVDRSNIIVECFEQSTRLRDLVRTRRTNRHALSYMKRYKEPAKAQLQCETDCARPADVDPNLPGMGLITIQKLHAEECITHDMLEDSAENLERWVAEGAAMQFVERENDLIINGHEEGKIEGLLSKGNHLEMPIANAGDPTWQELFAMPFQVHQQFAGNGEYWADKQMLQKILTIADADNRPIFNIQNVSQTGVFNLFGYPLRRITQMPDMLAADGTPIAGAKPIMFGDYRSAYLWVDRKGFTVSRNPWENWRCGVNYRFSMRIGGGGLCQYAAVAMVSA